MSTYYYLVCDKHKEYCNGASRTMGGFCHLCDSADTLPPFIITHDSCKVRITSEHDYSYMGYKEWTRFNIEEMYNMERDYTEDNE